MGLAVIAASVVSGYIPASAVGLKPTPTPTRTDALPPALRNADAIAPALQSVASAPDGTAEGGTEAMASDGLYGGVDLPFEREATFSYGPMYAQQLDAYWSSGKARRAGVVIFHGGYWMRGDKGAWRGLARLFAARGYAVFSANYRLAGEARWPAQRQDAMAALDYVKRNADRFNLDPDRIVAVGSSSGGQIAAMLGTYGEGRTRVAGVVAVSPAASPYQAYLDGAQPNVTGQRRKLRDATVRLVGCVPRVGAPVCWERLEETTAANHVSGGDAKMFLAHSTGDFVPSRHSIELGDRLKAAGIPVEVRILPGEDHGGDLLREPALFENILDWIGRAVQP